MTDSNVLRFTELFPGLDRAYGTYVLNGEVRADGKKEGDGDTRRHPVTYELWQAHLSGKRSLGIVPIRDGDTAVFGAVDIDVYQDFDLLAIVHKLTEQSIPALTLRSKSGGAHIYLFASEPIEAKVMRARLQEIAAISGHPKAEIFPKQDALTSADDCGSWINMPYFNGVAGGRYALGEDGRPLSPEEFLDSAESLRRPLAWFEREIPIPKAQGSANKVTRTRAEKPYQRSAELGNRVNYLGSELGRFIHATPDVGDSTITAYIEEMLSKCKPKLPTAEESSERRRLLTRAQRYKRVAAGQDQKEWRKYTELGNALRFLDWYGEDFRYNKTAGSWLIWNGRAWVKDDRGSAEKEMGHLSDILLTVDLPRAGGDQQQRKSVLNWHKSSQSSRGVVAALQQASVQQQVAVLSSDLDSDNYLLNCLNGTVDLRTGELRAHNPEDLITRCCPVEYHQDATLPEWESFLRTATQDDEEIINFLQRAAGYSLTGSTAEEKLFFLHGPGNSGKTTFLEALGSVLGNYGSTANFQSFLEKKHEGIPNDIARLDGPRFVCASETRRNTKLDTGVIKSLTGGDKITARFLRAEFFEFHPRFKLWLCANDAPEIASDDDGMWRRVVRVPFDYVVPEEKRDKRVKQRLCDPKIAGPAILAWAVRGCLAWQTEQKLTVPARLKTATAEYRHENDPLKDFLEERCVLDSKSELPCIDLYNTFKYWSQDCRGDYRPMDFGRFGSMLKKRGLPSKTKNIKGRSVRVYVGVAYRVNEPEILGPRALPPAQSTLEAAWGESRAA